MTSNGRQGGMLSGPSHAEGGVPARVGPNQRPIELEGGEAVINKTTIASDKTYTMTGTPAQIASATNSVDGNGVPFAEGAQVVDHQTGEVKQFAAGGQVEGFDYLWYLNWSDMPSDHHPESNTWKGIPVHKIGEEPQMASGGVTPMQGQPTAIPTDPGMDAHAAQQAQMAQQPVVTVFDAPLPPIKE